MCIVGEIMDVIPKWFHVFIQDRDAYQHRHTCSFCFFVYSPFQKYTNGNHLSTFTFICMKK